MMDQIPNYITAVATIGLLFATAVLAVYTKQLKDTSSSPQIIVVLQPSRWSLMHADIEVENTGNATAFDIEIKFDPPLLAEKTGRDDPMPAPFNAVGVLKPGQILTSFLGEVRTYIDTSYQITVSWTQAPGDEKNRKSLSYRFGLEHLKRASTLGPGDPASATANEIKKIREGILPFFSGRRRAEIDVYSQQDRESKAAAQQEYFEAMRVKSEKPTDEE